MTKHVILGILLLCAATAYAAAATITAEPCGEKCLLPSYPHVNVTLTRRIETGDLARLQKQYAAPAQFICLNRIEPGRYAMMTPNDYETWKKNSHQAQTSDANQSAPNSAAEKQCSKSPILIRLGYLDGMLLIDSAGGDVDEAMAIGQWLRKNRIGVTARGECASACVWVLAAGLTRIIWPHTKILIHRPYLTTTSSLNSGDRLRSLLHQSMDYFDMMGVPRELVERMFSTPPDDVTKLSEAEISYYRLDQASLEFQEEIDSVRAQNLGISKDEYISRRQQYNNLEKLSPCSTLVQSRDESTIIHELNECESNRLRAFGLEK